MKITIAPYNPDWKTQFQKIKEELSILLKELNPKIEHFGSTSVPGLSAKPVIDILVGIQDVNQFDFLVKKMSQNKRYIYYKVFNIDMPGRRLFVRLKDEVDMEQYENIFTEPEKIPHEKINHHRMAHVHVWEYGSDNWIRHIAFRDYLKTHEDVKLEYENLKKELSQKKWKHGMEYNDGKNEFIKREERKAVSWYLKNKAKVN